MARSRSFLAACLRKRRAELGFSRATAAVKTATSEDVFRKWECGREPLVASYPKIIEFLGRHPWPEPRGLPQQLRCARRARGLTIPEAAAELGVDPSTVWWWETSRKPHRIEDRVKIAVLCSKRTKYHAGVTGFAYKRRCESPSADT
jgi:transcriptional regulator with XRE-family HTH domain